VKAVIRKEQNKINLKENKERTKICRRYISTLKRGMD
jgi:hypothetical protein